MATVANLAFFVGIILAPFLAFRFGFPVLSRRLDGRPKITWALNLLSVALLLFAAASFGHFFPNCYVGAGLGITHCRM